MPKKRHLVGQDAIVRDGFPPLLESLRQLIVAARQKVLNAANVAQVVTYWEIGRHIVEFEQGGEARAAYGQRLLTDLAEALTRDFGKGFDASILRYMRLFYHAFPIRDALRHELSWTHYRLLLRVDSPVTREWYLTEAASQNWSTRVLERQIGSFSYERLLSSQESPVVADLPSARPSPRDFVRDPVLLEFLGLPDTGFLREEDLEAAMMENLRHFLLELGKGFAFVARQQRISSETQDFYIDLVFYNYLLKCFVLIDLKIGHLTHQDIGQMDMYVRLYDDLRRGEGDNPTVGILARTKQSLAIPYCTKANSCSPANTAWSSLPKKNCARNWNANGLPSISDAPRNRTSEPIPFEISPAMPWRA